MKVRVLVTILLALVLLAGPAAADGATRYIVRDSGGLTSLQNLCLLLGCTVAGGIDADLGKLFLVTTPDWVDPNLFLETLRSQTQIVNAELDLKLKIKQSSTLSAPPGLSDSSPTDYFGASVWHGYVDQPATRLIRLAETQATFNLTGTGIVAVIDTGVDPNHPVLQAVLISGEDFTRNQKGGSERRDLDRTASAGKPGQVNQRTMAVIDPSTATTLSGPQYAAFGHGTMVAGIIHLVAPGAAIMPLKAFGPDGSGYTSDVLRAIYWAVHNGANVINMSFSFPAYSQEVATAANFATNRGVVCVAAVGNDGQERFVYPAALANVLGIASTSDDDARSSFSNYGPDLVYAAAPGEAIVTTYPFGFYAAGWGTSFSTPFVSGAVALLRGVNGNCDQSCAAFAVAHARWISEDLGKGRLDLYEAALAWRKAMGVD